MGYGHSHGESHGHSHDGFGSFSGPRGVPCECVALQEGWSIDCDLPTDMISAIDYLNDPENGCLIDGGDSSNNTRRCANSYLILQAHHDHCAHGELPEGADPLLHMTDGMFGACSIQRAPDPTLPPCESTECIIQDLLAASEALYAYDCAQDCARDECSAWFKSVVVGHDTCAKDELPYATAQAVFDFSSACVQESCNPFSIVHDHDSQVCENDALDAVMGGPSRNLVHLDHDAQHMLEGAYASSTVAAVSAVLTLVFVTAAVFWGRKSRAQRALEPSKL